MKVIVLFVSLILAAAIQAEETPLKAKDSTKPAIQSEVLGELKKSGIEVIDLSVKDSNESTNRGVTFFLVVNQQLPNGTTLTIYAKNLKPFRRIRLRLSDLVSDERFKEWLVLRKYKSKQYTDEVFEIKDRCFLYMKTVPFLDSRLVKKISLEKNISR